MISFARSLTSLARRLDVFRTLLAIAMISAFAAPALAGPFEDAVTQFSEASFADSEEAEGLVPVGIGAGSADLFFGPFDGHCGFELEGIGEGGHRGERVEASGEAGEILAVEGIEARCQGVDCITFIGEADEQ